ncbi:hypothetical protein [Salinispira pacifica]|uniref:Uncharacterized protein n=1 Tax=Salinispira pacifica TaxID=1307761 RepID=V5WD07_9SPIO|nr:hypothetical protein [Salinispira pacifica]AHC13485.1 hypothetical protein L21SP2_0039 [Salinispira pacifica]
MTVRTRNGVYWLLFILIIVSTAAASILTIYTFLPGMLPELSLDLPGVPFISTPQSSLPDLLKDGGNLTGRVNLLRVTLISAGSLIISLASAGVFLRFFRRISASHLMFFFLFLVSLSGESLKAFSLYLYILGADLDVLVILTRVCLSMYLGGLFSVFLISLYFVGIKFQHQGTAMIIIVAVSMFISLYLPVDTSSFSRNFLYTLAYSGRLQWMAGGVILITILGYALHFWERFSKDEFLRVLSASMFMIGHSLMFFSQGIAGSAAGSVLLGVGIVMYFLRLFYDFFWY